RVTGSPLQLQVSEISGAAGATIESGTLSLDLLRATPFVGVELATGELDLARFFGDGGGGGQDPAARWSRQPLGLGALRDLDAEVALEAAGLRHGELVLAPASLRAKLEAGLLTLERLEGIFHEGRLSAHGRLDAAAGTPTADLTLAFAGVDAGAVLRPFGTERVRGRLDLEAELSSRGNSEAALVTALGGQATLGGELTLEAQAQEQIGNIVLGILGQQVSELRGVTNPLNELFSAFAGRPGQLSGTVRVAEGVATTSDLQLAGQGARLRARGTLANLPAWTMAVTAALYREDAGEPQVEIDLDGALDEPNLRLKGAALSIAPGGGSGGSRGNSLEQILRNALPGARQQPEPPADALEIAPEEPGGEQDQAPPHDSPPPKPEDVLRGLIQGLGRGG
ncbi:MAG: AsmA-like C-terminal region-containing protein, partial [Tistlia sp.]